MGVAAGAQSAARAGLGHKWVHKEAHTGVHYEVHKGVHKEVHYEVHKGVHKGVHYEHMVISISGSGGREIQVQSTVVYAHLQKTPHPKSTC
jgi:hypothetical protein